MVKLYPFGEVLYMLNLAVSVFIRKKSGNRSYRSILVMFMDVFLNVDVCDLNVSPTEPKKLLKEIWSRFTFDLLLIY